jgi:hypothetical protein
MILRLGYEVFPEIGRSSLIDPYLDYVYSINLEEATA